MKYGFVILHYLTANDTIECINSIFKYYDKDTFSIVVVDNFSNNGSIEKVEEYFAKEESIFFIKNKENLGFAKGNNVGYRYCKNELKCDTIIISNNDIILRSDNIINNIWEDMQKYNCAIIGPDIESLVDNKHQNPMECRDISYISIKKEILKYRILNILNTLNLYRFFQSIFSNNNEIDVNNNFNELQKNVQLHGSFLVFTKIFVSKMENAFCENTFLYLEETILKKICEKEQFITIYDPNIKVFHKEDSSTNALNRKSKQKRKFVFKNLIKSYKVLLKLLD